MNKFLRTVLIALLPLPAAAALTVNNGGGATNITSTSAWLVVSVASTGASSPSLYIYWGTNDGGSNVLGWKHTNSIGVATQTTYSAKATNLSGSTIYYYRALATNSTETNWATYTAQFITLTTPTSAPPSSVRAVSVDTNAVLKNPTNFFTVNSNSIKSAIGFSGDTDTNAVWGNIIGTLSNQTDLQSALDGKATTGDMVQAQSDISTLTGAVAVLQASTSLWNTAATDASAATGDVAIINGNLSAISNAYLIVEGSANVHVTLTPTGQVLTVDAGYATGTPLYVESDPVWASEKSGYATGTPVYAESDPVWSGVSGTVVYTNDAIYLAVLTNATEVVLTNSWGWEKDGDHQIRILVDTNTPLESVLTAHTGNTNNPHAVTSIQIGALPMAGGSMTGVLFYGTNRLYLGSDTNAPWIRGLGTTNIMFGAGTNTATFGAPW